jgi:hypothetical protein
MGGRDFSRKDQLQAGVQRLSDTRLARHGRVFENQHAPFGFFRRDDLPSLENALADCGVLPQRCSC